MKSIPILYFKTGLTLFFLAGLISGPIFSKSQASPENWPAYNRTYNGDHYAPLKQITTSNISKLRLLHRFDLGNDVGSLQTGMVVIDGIMYFTADTSTYAIHVESGKLKWRSTRPLSEQSMLKVNRGVAYSGEKLFRGSSNGHVYALNAADGKQLWDVKPDVASPGITTPMAPLAWNGMVFIGNAGGDNSGITGHAYALDVNDGHVIWSFNVVPQTDPARATWPAAAKGIPISGGAFWTSFSLDAENGVLYVPPGNPAPHFDVKAHEGDNLYTNCVIALDTKTGNMLGYVQLVRRDLHDWDVSTAPVLITTKSGWITRLPMAWQCSR